MMSTTVLETCRGIYYTYYKTRIYALIWLITKIKDALYKFVTVWDFECIKLNIFCIYIYIYIYIIVLDLWIRANACVRLHLML